MRLISTRTMKFVEVVDPRLESYAILSHTWEAEEVTFRDMVSGSSTEAQARSGYAKIMQTCRLAADMGLEYAWVDTCCIDKSSSAEVSEAINSMFKWYQYSTICIVVLSDFWSDDPSCQLSRCRWFTRGWTLQELIAPTRITFYDAAWRDFGTKAELSCELSQITGIDEEVLHKTTALKTIPAAAKMSWASMRTTTRQEDTAYCLLGLFDCHMPLLYGEGPKAFQRLQEEIARTSTDLTIFAWTPLIKEMMPQGLLWSTQCCGAFADSPAVFRNAGKLRHKIDSEFSVTNRGIRISTAVLEQVRPFSGERAADGQYFYPVLPLARTQNGGKVGLVLRRFDIDMMARDDSISSGLLEYSEDVAGAYLRSWTVFIPHDPAFIMHQDAVQALQRSQLALDLQPGLRIWGVQPEVQWDSASRALLCKGREIIALIVGCEQPALNVFVAILLRARPLSRLYVLRYSAPETPLLLGNLPLLSSWFDDGFSKSWNLRPVYVNPPEAGSTGGSTSSASLDFDNLTLVLRFRAMFDGGEVTGNRSLKNVRASHLEIGYSLLSRAS